MSAKVTLTVSEGQLKGQQFSFDSRDSCIIGRHQDCKIRIPSDKYHAAISRYHCLLDINPPDIRVRDFGSLHGTYVNGKCIGKRKEQQTPSAGANLDLSEHDLKDGDVITLSNTSFLVSIEETAGVASTFIIAQNIDDIPAQPEIESDSNLGSIDKYTKVKKLGQGGFGEVYLARLNDSTDTRLVALKTLHPRVAVMPEMKARFLGEARRTKMLDHPNIVKFDDYGQVNDLFYFTMEYCDRGSVVDLIKQRGGKLSVKEATDIILQVLNGLHYAHTEKGLVHRDIKPANIFLTLERGEIVAKLGDYGLAKAFDLAGLSGQTLTGTAMGTPHCMPRQQVLDFKYVQPNVDVWATVATLYFMLTGTYPRKLEGVANPMLEILTKPPVPIREINPSIPAPLADLIDLALIDYPELHFENAISLKQALIKTRQF